MARASRIGVLTGGGDVPGLNPAIRAVVRKGIVEGLELVGLRNGWIGLLEADALPLDLPAISGTLPRGGTMLGTSRVDPFAYADGTEGVSEAVERLGLDGLVVLGGEGTLKAALRLSELGVRLAGIPKTIDNDVPGTEYCLGFNSAVSVVMAALDRLHPTAEAHHRVMVVEVMGHGAGWLATWGGLAGGADVILVPEAPVSLEAICERLHSREVRGKEFSLVVVAEGTSIRGVSDSEERSMRGLARALADAIQASTGFETRLTTLGHVQRGGSPSAMDRVVGTQMGARAVESLLGDDGGRLVARVGEEVTSVPLSVVSEPRRTVDLGLYGLARLFY